jgi:hypothetical protein
MLDRIDLPQGTLDLLILRTLAQRHPGKSVGRTYSSIPQDNGEDVKVMQEPLRHSSSKKALDAYEAALTPTKRAVQRKVVAMIRQDLSVPRSTIHAQSMLPVDFDFTDACFRDRNYPSVIMWSIGNEISERSDPDGVRIAKDLSSRVRELDTSRPVTMAVPFFFDATKPRL